MSFVKYPSLENHTNDKFLYKIQTEVDSSVIWNAREKIHGTNFSVIINADTITPAKRTGEIKITEKFFGYEDLMAKYKNKFESIQKSLDDKGCDEIQIFGEYAGGNIQKEVDYGDKDLYVFDVIFKKGEDGFYLNDLAVESFTLMHGLKIAPLIARGPLVELLKLPVEFESVVKEYDELFDESPALAIEKFEQPKPKNNVAEGLVIKPNETLFLNGGSRVAIKYKTDAFKEKGKAKMPKIVTPLPESDLELLAEFTKYVTPARIGNVVSHIGEVTAKEFGKVLGLTLKDIFEEAGREGVTIDKAEQPAKLKRELQQIVTTEIRAIWTNIIS